MERDTKILHFTFYILIFAIAFMVELRDLIRLCARTIPAMVVGGIAGALVLGLWVAAATSTPQWEATASVRFEEVRNEEMPAPVRDGYYVVETERRFGALLGEVLLAQDTQQALNEQAGVTVKDVARINPLDYRVTTSGASPAQERTRTIMESVVGERLGALVAASGEPLQVGASIAGVQEKAPFPVWVGALAGFFLGAGLVLSWVLLRVYMRGGLKEESAYEAGHADRD